MHCLDYWDWLFHFISQNSTKTFGIQEAARNKQEQHINKHFENFISESCSNFLFSSIHTKQPLYFCHTSIKLECLYNFRCF